MSPLDRQPALAELLRAARPTGRLHHAHLLLGRDAEVALRTAQAMAAALLCARDPLGCGACPSCRAVAAGNHPDLTLLAPNERGAIAVDDVRAATARLALTASAGGMKILVIDRAEAMSPAAQNALLKTLEEPPGRTCILLAATRLRALLPTIRSRLTIAHLRPHPEALRAELPDLAAELVPVVEALSNGEARRARALVELDLPAVVGALRALFASPPNAAGLIAWAQDWGGEREKAELALAVLEAAVRDGLARRHGVPEVALLGGLGIEGTGWTRAAAALTEARRLSAINLNRTLVLEQVLFALAGAEAASAA